MIYKMRAPSTRLAVNKKISAFPADYQKDPVEKKTTLLACKGRWQKDERIAFLKGLRRHGKGKWKQISTMIPTRTTTQIKTHAQVVLRRMHDGEDVLGELGLESNFFDPNEDTVVIKSDRKTLSDTTNKLGRETVVTHISEPIEFGAVYVLTQLRLVDEF